VDHVLPGFLLQECFVYLLFIRHKPGTPGNIFPSPVRKWPTKVLDLPPAGIGYDRNGDGDSEEDSTVRTDADLVQRLHALLEALSISPPYILIGHFMGGAYIRLFTSLYPGEVAGLIFIDGPNFMMTKQQDEELKKLSPGDKSANDLAIHAMDSIANDTLQGSRVRHRSRRLASFFRTGIFREYDSLAPLPDIPVGVLIA